MDTAGNVYIGTPIRTGFLRAILMGLDGCVVDVDDLGGLMIREETK